MKVTNLPMPMKKSFAPRSAKPKSAKKGDDSSEIYSNIMPFDGGLSPIGKIVLESSPPPSARTRSNRRPTTGKPRPTASQTSVDTPPFSRTRDNKRYVIPNFTSYYFYIGLFYG